MVKWRGSTPKERDERKARLHIGELVEDHRRFHRLQVIKDKLDLYGEESLDLEEREIARLFPDFFYPEEDC